MAANGFEKENVNSKKLEKAQIGQDCTDHEHEYLEGKYDAEDYKRKGDFARAIKATRRASEHLTTLILDKIAVFNLQENATRKNFEKEMQTYIHEELENQTELYELYLQEARKKQKNKDFIAAAEFRESAGDALSKAYVISKKMRIKKIKDMIIGAYSAAIGIIREEINTAGGHDALKTESLSEWLAKVERKRKRMAEETVR
jgi:hypothetical protein